MTIGDIPDGAVLTLANGDAVTVTNGSAELSADDLAGLTITPPEDFAGTFDLSVVATSTEANGGDTAETTGTISVNVDAVADAADLSVSAASGTEDNAIPLSITAASTDADGSESVSVTISGIPEGAVLADANGDPITITNGAADVSTDQLAGLTITPPADSDGDFTLDVSVTTTDGTDTETVSGQLDVSVAADADAPTLDLGAVASGDEDSAIALDISSALTDTDGSETLSVTIGDIPDGAVLTLANGDAVTVTNGSAELSADDLAGLTITPPEDFAGTFDLSVVATSTEANGGDTAETTGTISVNVDAVADAADLSVSAASGTEDNAIPLSITAASTDADGSESVSVTISGIPEGAVLADANGDPITITNGAADVSTDQLAGLTITPPADSDGDFTLDVSVTTTDGTDTETVSGQLDVSVAADADAPTLDLGAVASGDEDSAIALDISSALTDTDGSETLSVTIGDIPDGAVLTLANGDAVTVTNGSAELSADDLAGLTITPPEDFAGTFDLSVVATSTEANGGDTAETTGTISVNVDGVADGAVVSLNDASGFEDTVIPLDIDVSAVDVSEDVSVEISGIPDGASLTYVDADGATQSITATNGSVELTVDQLNELSITPPANSDADFALTVETTTTDGSDTNTTTNTLNVAVEAVADDPTLTTSDAEGVEDTAIDLDIQAALTDTDGSETISVTLSNIPNGSVLTNADGWQLTIEEGVAQVDVDDLPGLTITPPEDFTGSFDLQVTATSTEAENSDTAGVTDTSVITVTVDNTNDGPIANADAGTTDEDSSVTLNVLANDTDADGDSLTVTGATLEEGAAGSVTVNDDGSLSFDPGDGYQELGVGESTTVDITYTISDGQGGTDTATATVTIEGTNDGPVANADTLSGTEDTAITFSASDLLGNDTDVDGDTLSIASFDQPDGGTITLNDDGSYTFTPDADFNGETTFTYTVEDPSGAQSQATVTIDVDGVNDGPVAADDVATASEDGGAVQIDVLANDTDLDGDSLTVTGATLEEGAAGSVTVNDDGSLSFDPGDGYQELGVGESTTVDITYTISDGQGGTDTATATVTIEGTNDGPVANADTLSGTEDTAITFSASDLLGNDTDVDGDTLSIASFDQPDGGTITLNDDGSYTFTPDADFNGETTFTYTVEDPSGAQSQATVTIDVDGVNTVLLRQMMLRRRLRTAVRFRLTFWRTTRTWTATA